MCYLDKEVKSKEEAWGEVLLKTNRKVIVFSLEEASENIAVRNLERANVSLKLRANSLAKWDFTLDEIHFFISRENIYSAIQNEEFTLSLLLLETCSTWDTTQMYKPVRPPPYVQLSDPEWTRCDDTYDVSRPTSK